MFINNDYCPKKKAWLGLQSCNQGLELELKSISNKMGWSLSLSFTDFEGLELVLKLLFTGLDPTLCTVTTAMGIIIINH